MGNSHRLLFIKKIHWLYFYFRRLIVPGNILISKFIKKKHLPYPILLWDLVAKKCLRLLLYLTKKMGIFGSLPFDIIGLISKMLDDDSYFSFTVACPEIYDEYEILTRFRINRLTSRNVCIFLQKGSPFLFCYEHILDNRGTINLFEVSNYYPFRVIARRGYYHIMKFLFEKGLNYDAIRSNKSEILLEAVKKNDLSMFRFLMEYGLTWRDLVAPQSLVVSNSIKKRRNDMIKFFVEVMGLPIRFSL